MDNKYWVFMAFGILASGVSGFLLQKTTDEITKDYIDMRLNERFEELEND